jgi:hypothetical protein
MQSLSEPETVKARHEALVETHPGVQTKTELHAQVVLWLYYGSRL